MNFGDAGCWDGFVGWVGRVVFCFFYLFFFWGGRWERGDGWGWIYRGS